VTIAVHNTARSLHVPLCEASRWAGFFRCRVVAAEAPPIFLLKWGRKGSVDGQFDHPWGVAVDNRGNVYVAEEFNSRIQKFDGQGNFLLKWGGFRTVENGKFYNPCGVAVDNRGNVYVADTDNQRIQKFR